MREHDPTGSGTSSDSAEEGGRLRDESAAERDLAAGRRDGRADVRDCDAESADERALARDSGEAASDGNPREQELRARAARDRSQAAHDRTDAASDRVLGARDRASSKQDREDAGIDELTGARRRGVGLDELEREIARARRTGANVVVAYVDVDGLKQVNDEHGHGAGDEVLREAAARLRHQMRTYDLLVRVGGDEFLCVLPGASLEGVERRFRDLGSKLPEWPDTGSVSIGLSELRDGEGAEELVARADNDLLAVRADSRQPLSARG